MLKKAGIVAAIATAGLLGLGGLAFAGDYEGGHHGHHGDGDRHGASCQQDNKVKNDAEGHGLVNVQNTNVQVPVQACNNSVLEGVLGIFAHHQSNEDSHG